MVRQNGTVGGVDDDHGDAVRRDPRAGHEALHAVTGAFAFGTEGRRPENCHGDRGDEACPSKPQTSTSELTM
jgi:hypothetical protein